MCHRTNFSNSRMLSVHVARINCVYKQATIKIFKRTKIGKLGRPLAPRHKPRLRYIRRRSELELVSSVCEFLREQRFEKGNVLLTGDALQLFETRSISAHESQGETVSLYPRHSASGAGELCPDTYEIAQEKVPENLDGEALRRRRELESAARRLEEIAKERTSNSSRWFKKYVRGEDRNKDIKEGDIVRIDNILFSLRLYYDYRLLGFGIRKSAEDAGRQCSLVTGRTVMSWAHEFESGRGALWVPRMGEYGNKCLLDEEDVALKCLEFVIKNADKKGCPNMTALEFSNYVHSKILPDLKRSSAGRSLLTRCHVGGTLSTQASRRWLKKLGFSYSNRRVTGFCDGRNRSDVQKYKLRYCEIMQTLQKYMPMWTHLTKEKFLERFEGAIPKHWYVGEDEVEFSIDLLTDDEVLALSHRFRGDWSRRPKPAIPWLGVKENDKLLLFSQDESVFKSNDDGISGWRKDGVNTARRKKSEGRGIMVSGFVSECDGILSFSEEELFQVENKYGKPLLMTRSLSKLLEVQNSAGFSATAHQYGKNYDGYWDNAKIMLHSEEFLRCAAWRYREEGVRFLILFDWSSGHAAMAKDALVASKMAWGYGGQQPKMHPAIIQDHYPNANNPYLRSIGAVQSMVFGKDEKPFYEIDSEKDFCGMAKGMKQVLWERGLWTEKMRMKRRGEIGSENTAEMCGLDVMSAQTDFQWECCALARLVADLGHLCLFTPKFHPELNFIERVWGRAKWYLRHFCEYNFPSLRRKLGRALGLEELTEKERKSHQRLKNSPYGLSKFLIWKYARKSRDYVRIYTLYDAKAPTGKHIKTVKYHRGVSKRELHGEE